MCINGRFEILHDLSRKLFKNFALYVFNNRRKLLFDFAGHFSFCIVMYYRCIHFIGSHFTCKWKGDLRKIFSCHIYGLSLLGICYSCTMTTFSHKRTIFFAFESCISERIMKTFYQTKTDEIIAVEIFGKYSNSSIWMLILVFWNGVY